MDRQGSTSNSLWSPCQTSCVTLQIHMTGQVDLSSTPASLAWRLLLPETLQPALFSYLARGWWCSPSAQLWLRGLARAMSCSLLSAEHIGMCCHPAFSGLVHPDARPLCSAHSVGVDC